MNPTKILFGAEGRINRAQFWLGYGILFTVGLVLGMIPLVKVLAGVVLIYPHVCVMTKRLHDFNRSGWWQVIPMVVGGACMVAAGFSAFNPGGFAHSPLGGARLGFLALYVVVAFGFVIFAGSMKGSDGRNSYGWPNGRRTQDKALLVFD